jgi:Spy/CpxP family protein refolding chaperone
MESRWGRWVAALLIAAAPVGMMAQGRQAPPSGEAMVSPAEIQRMLDGYMLIQAQEMLQLTDEQFPRFLSRLRDLQATRRRTQGERLRILQDLRRTTAARGGPIDESVIRERLKALDELDGRAAAEIKAQQTAVDQVLTPVQQARFRIFEETMEQRKIELLMRARQGRGRLAQPNRRQ